MAGNKSYSYKAARYSTGRGGMVKHSSAIKTGVKTYNFDRTIAQKHYDYLRTAQRTGRGAPPSQVAPSIPNSGNPLKFSNSTDVTTLSKKEKKQYEKWVEAGRQSDLTNQSVSMDDTIFTHEKMGDFHSSRSLAFMDAARNHTLMSFALAKEAAELGIKLEEAAQDSDNKYVSSVPSLFDFHPDPAIHDPDKAMDYHMTLIGESLMEAQEYRRNMEAVKTKMDKLPPDASPEDKMKLREAMEVNSSMYDLYSHLSEIHSTFAGDFVDYTKRRADMKPGYEPDNTTDNPPHHSPDLATDVGGGGYISPNVANVPDPV